MNVDNLVPACGPQPATVLVIGEAPGRQEYAQKKPFVGPTGREQEMYFHRSGLHTAHWRFTNVVPLYFDGNPDPSPQLVKEWTPYLIDEIKRTQPRVIVAVGRFAMRWFLGEDADLERCQGLPHLPGTFDLSRIDRRPDNDCVVIPVTHPAAGMHSGDARVQIDYGYQLASEIIKQAIAGKYVEPHVARDDDYLHYEDVSGAELVELVRGADVISLDTEGDPDTMVPWSLQITVEPKTGYMLRYSRDDFHLGVHALQDRADNGALFVIHNAMFDIEMSRAMGLELRRARIWDSMYAAYLTGGREPQGLKPLAYRLAKMKMTSYEETVGVAGRKRQLEYLWRTWSDSKAWPKPEPRLVVDNAGIEKMYKPQSMRRRTETILTDCYNDKTVDPYKRWMDVDSELRAVAEAKFGKLAASSLDDLPLTAAVSYGCRDTDATLRVYHSLLSRWSTSRLAGDDVPELRLMREGMEVLPVFEEMQYNGLPASRSRIEALHLDMSEKMVRLQREISKKYYEGKPFNPKSSDQTASILRRRGLEPAERTKGGKMSTGKRAIQHLRQSDEAVAAIMNWREHQHTRDMFAEPLLAMAPPDTDQCQIRCRLKITRTTTRRLASTQPNLLAITKHSEFGKMIRECFVCPPGQVLLESDLSQIEMRMMAHESDDPVLVSIYNDPTRDLHTETACKLFGVTPDTMTKDQRTFSKRINFGIPYGVSEHGLETQLRMIGVTGWSTNDIARLIVEWHKLYKVCSKYFRATETEATRTGMIRDCWGMPRYLPGVWADDPKVAAEARRQAVNHKIQGGAQGLLQRAIAYLKPIVWGWQDQGMNVRWGLTIHDSVILQLDEELVPVVEPVVLDAMSKHVGMKLRVPVVADSKVSNTWGGL